MQVSHEILYGIKSFYDHKEGISLRKVNETDLPDLMNLKNESWFGTVNTVCLNIHDQRKWFEKISNDSSSMYFICSSDLGRGETDNIGLYGFTDIDPINQSCSFTHSLYERFRGQGLGKKTLYAGIDMTFEVFNMRRIETWILENNQAEIAVAKSVGFVGEGSKRKAIYKCNEYLDCNLYGLLRDEWQATDRVKDYKGLCNTSYMPKTR